jgi:predicted fused transcriptional regulator/phosphomethylpyrimidine kinase
MGFTRCFIKEIDDDITRFIEVLIKDEDLIKYGMSKTAPRMIIDLSKDKRFYKSVINMKYKYDKVKKEYCVNKEVKF